MTAIATHLLAVLLGFALGLAVAWFVAGREPKETNRE